MTNLSTKKPAAVLSKKSKVGDFVTWVLPTNVRKSGVLKAWEFDKATKTHVAVVKVDGGTQRVEL